MGQAGDVFFGGDKGDAESEDAGSDVACLSDAMDPLCNGNSIIYERVCELVFFFLLGVLFPLPFPLFARGVVPSDAPNGAQRLTGKCGYA